MRRTRLLDNEILVLRNENTRLQLENQGTKEKVKDNVVSSSYFSSGSGQRPTEPSTARVFEYFF